MVAVAAAALVGTSAYGASPGDGAGDSSDRSTLIASTGRGDAAVDETAPAVGDLAMALGGTDLSGWNLTLPVAGSRGTAASLPATLVPPWLTENTSGGVSFWAPAGGASTAHSTHARTELKSLNVFAAGSSKHALTASVAVTQVPAAGEDVIIGQIHGAGSVPFVMLHYRGGVVEVVVKRQPTGSAHDTYVLMGVRLGDRFGFGIADNGDGTMTFTATYGEQQVTKDVRIPAGFTGKPVRFQAGAYELSSAGAAAAGDGARVTFYALDQR